MSPEAKTDLHFEIAHLLLIDVVGYSKLLSDQQIELLRELNRLVRNTPHFRLAEAGGKLIRLPTGDGMALLFFHSPEEPAQCALEISDALRSHPEIQLRMGAHSGPVNEITDVNDRSNVAGAGINIAQRVMDCGDAGHILLSKHMADDLAQHSHWRPHLYDLGECEVKHGLKLHIVNLYKDDLGNPKTPTRLRGAKWRERFKFSRSFLFLLIATLFLVAVAVAFVFYRAGSRSMTGNLSASSIIPPITIPQKSIAVLPFENLSDEKQNTFFADGVQDEILNDLTRVADLKVISRTSVMQYRNRRQRNLREIATALGVSHILEGTVQRIGGRVRVSAQLIDARTDMHVWGNRFDRDLADVFELESELAEQIVSQLKAKISPAEKIAMEEKPTTDLDSYNLYARARSVAAAFAFDARREENLSEAVRLLDQCVGRAPSFFLAYCELARRHDEIYHLGIDHTPARLVLADAALQSALKLRPDAGEAHLARAYHLYCGFLDYDQARQDLAIAKQALPNESRIFEVAGFIDRRQGHWEDSTRNFEHALELDPRNFSILQQLSLNYEPQRRFAEMAGALDRALALVPGDRGTRIQRAVVDLEARADPKPLRAAIEQIVAEDTNAAGNIAYGWIYLALCERDGAAATRALAVLPPDGCRTEGVVFPHAWCEGVAFRAVNNPVAGKAAFLIARAETEKIVSAQPSYAQALCVLGMIDAGLGRKEEAIREGRRAVELLPVSKDSINGTLLLEYLAVIYAWTGEKDLALEQLATVAQIPSDISYGQLRLHPYWDPLRSDPRFEKIVASLAPRQ